VHSTDTIIALSTATGRAGIAIIRVSGGLTRFVLETISGDIGAPRLARVCKLRFLATGHVIDQAVVLFFPAPNSFTGEDIAEFHVHGSRAVVASVLDEITSLSADIRHAEAGEFARRAFENGKMDLAEIEGLADLIDSETEWQRRQALRLMQGDLGQLAKQWREKLIVSLAYLDAEIDFSDEADVGTGWTAVALTGIKDVAESIASILLSARSGERLREGLEVVILGAPNAGKSSLLNAIARRDVAIVTEIAGTTRDLIEVKCDLEGLPVTLIDTAGLRQTVDPIEIEGIRRALGRAEIADLVLLVRAVDSDQEHSLIPDGLIPDGQVITLNTKFDLGIRSTWGMLSVSANSGEGVPELLAEIALKLKSKIGLDTAIVTRARQRVALENGLSNLRQAQRELQGTHGMITELAAENLRRAILALEQLLGKVDVEDVLDQIFGSFCIGK
jgi:tRNA modification GTPase